MPAYLGAWDLSVIEVRLPVGMLLVGLSALLQPSSPKEETLCNRHSERPCKTEPLNPKQMPGICT